MSALPYDGLHRIIGHDTTGRLVAAGTQPPSGKRRHIGRLTIACQTAKPATILTSGVVQVPVMGTGILSPSTGRMD